VCPRSRCGMLALQIGVHRAAAIHRRRAVCCSLPTRQVCTISPVLDPGRLTCDLMALLRHTTWRSLRRRLIAGATLLAYVTTLFGVPLPALAARESGRAFACQGLLCGCMTVEQFQNCCCQATNEPAICTRGDDPAPQPPPVEEPKAVSSCCCGTGAVTPETCPHCTPKEQQAPCSTPAKGDVGTNSAAKKPSNDEVNKPVSSCCPSHGKSPDQDTDGLRWSLVGAWRCQGLTLHWMSTGVIAATIPVAWAPTLPPSGWLIATATPSVNLPFIPPDPPPRT
jgi:hypothetical protein